MEKHSKMLSLIDELLNCLEGSSSSHENFYTISNWKEDFKNFRKDIEKVLDIKVDFEETRNLFNKIAELEDLFSNFQEEFDKDETDSEILKLLQDEIKTKLMDLGQALKSIFN